MSLEVGAVLLKLEPTEESQSKTVDIPSVGRKLEWKAVSKGITISLAS